MTTDNTKQDNFEDGYRENIYDETNLGDNALTDTFANPNPQLTGYSQPENWQQPQPQREMDLDD